MVGDDVGTTPLKAIPYSAECTHRMGVGRLWWKRGIISAMNSERYNLCPWVWLVSIFSLFFAKGGLFLPQVCSVLV